MTDALRRSIRTFVQAFVGSFATSGVLAAANTSGVVDWSLAYKAGVSAVSAGFIAVVALVQNWAEDSPKVALPAVLKPEPLPVKKVVRAKKAAKKQ